MAKYCVSLENMVMVEADGELEARNKAIDEFQGILEGNGTLILLSIEDIDED